MQKKRALIIFVIIFLVIAIICIFIYVGSDDVKYNNTKSKEELITVKYTSSQIEELKNSVYQGRMTLKELKKKFKVQCVRKTPKGYYTILSQEDGKEAFVFFDSDLKLWDMFIVDEFKTKETFQQGIVEKKTTRSQMVEYDKTYIPMPTSSMSSSVHCVKEGVFIVIYSRRMDGKRLPEPIVDSIEFMSNDEVLAKSEDPYIYNIPIIMEMDKN